MFYKTHQKPNHNPNIFRVLYHNVRVSAFPLTIPTLSVRHIFYSNVVDPVSVQLILITQNLCLPFRHNIFFDGIRTNLLIGTWPHIGYIRTVRRHSGLNLKVSVNTDPFFSLVMITVPLILGLSR